MLVSITMFSSTLRHYWFAFAATILVFIGVVFGAGWAALWPVFILALVEITFSFDNAVLNSEVLSRMSKVWRVVFLTVGIAIAVFGVRLLMPLILVSATTGGSVSHVLDLALHNPDEYAEQLHLGYPVIAAFGGIFLLMIGLRFLAEERDAKWVPFIEHNISRHQRPWLIPIAGGLLTVGLVSLFIKPGHTNVTIAALLGIVTFLAIKVISVVLESGNPDGNGGHAQNWVNFLYLELLDASFSFDGVVAAFAITKDVLLITAGLGIGALFVRSITVHLLEDHTLNNYRYLVHGAHYAIAALGIMMLVTLRFELPEWFTGLFGITIIAMAFYSSIRHNRKSLKASNA